ncbi:glutaredoxin family protein [Scleromatobacter humisilvae]|uniref:Glutaredoxin family protein n=1 Tax=Scleromatobacter humisilvae TaxID=2897159 RepID=A0A9X1YMU5_9BURK|nr:glutaredoxin family protein [Scleromatobacter humisilvae]MCK9689204.1 glutaredoxin family protein [Scleromatobacter humisilvae]
MTPLKNASSAASRSTRALRLATVAMLLGGAAAGALAQYKIVGPDGKVTYTDKPPTAADIRLNNGTTPSVSNGNAAGGMPAQTRQAMSKYPVTLYASKNCGPCDQARDALRQRGVPYNEYSVNMDADISALQARFGDRTVPVIAIGSQTMRGYSSNDLQGYLDAAGYPAQAKLSGYRWPLAVALAPPSTTPLSNPSAANAPEAASSPASLLPPPSKSGIQF